MKPEHKKAISKSLLGRKLSKSHRLNIGKKSAGLKPARWVKNPTYTAIHHWVYRLFGFPPKCEQCGFKSTSNHKIHWANISGTYKRMRDDWMRLCAKCHRHYDLNRLKIS